MRLITWIVLWMALLTGCGTHARIIRLNTGQAEPFVLTPRSFAEPMTVDKDSFEVAVAKLSRNARLPVRPQSAARQLFDVSSRSGFFEYNGRTRHLFALGSGVPREDAFERSEAKLTRDYLHWCARTGRPGDCLRLLQEGPLLDGDGRYTLAMALAQGTVLDELLEAFKDMADPHAMVSAVLWTCTTYMLLLTVPEPVSKGIAAVMTATLMAYVGVDTFWSLVVGFRPLMDEAERATTFNALREADARYGKVMGRNAARAFTLLATAAIGDTARGLSTKVSELPGAARATVRAEVQLGLRLAAVGDVASVAMSDAWLRGLLP
jgi:hypothetical protein